MRIILVGGNNREGSKKEQKKEKRNARIISSSAVSYTHLFNTLVVTIISTAGVLVTTVLAAYAFARLNFPGKKIMLSLMLATLMIPGEMLIITNFITITKLKWINTYQAMIVPYLASVFYIYLLTQFFSQVPDALYLAAKVDKCNDFKYLIKIMIPINKSPITTICILNAIGCWNSFMWPSLVTNSKEMRVLSYGLMQFQTENGLSLIHICTWLKGR